MSFYLLPPVSYQTQQKLKNQVERKKQSKHKHRHDSKSSTRTHRQQSIDSSASSIRSPPKLVRSPSIFTKNTGERSIDELSNLDSLSIRSDNSNQSNQTTKTTKTTKSSKSDKERKAKNHTYNYTHTTDINEIIKYGRSHRSKYASSHVTPSNYSAVSQYEPSNYTASQYSPSECSSSLYSDLADDRHPPQAGVNPNFKLDFNKVPQMTTRKPNLEPIMDSPSSESHLDNSDGYKNSFEYSDEEQDEEDDTNKLTRVYSDVDSIFSTKSEVPKSKLKFFGA